jgi:hypothetical protein
MRKGGLGDSVRSKHDSHTTGSKRDIVSFLAWCFGNPSCFGSQTECPSDSDSMSGASDSGSAGVSKHAGEESACVAVAIE